MKLGQKQDPPLALLGILDYCLLAISLPILLLTGTQIQIPGIIGLLDYWAQQKIERRISKLFFSYLSNGTRNSL